MAIGKEVGNVLSAFGELLAYMAQGHRYTDEEYKAISDLASMINVETSLYRLEHSLHSTDITH